MHDYSKLASAFLKLSKPAQRALLNANIFSPANLARQSRAEVAALHGIGPSAFPVLDKALAASGLHFDADDPLRKR